MSNDADATSVRIASDVRDTYGDVNLAYLVFSDFRVGSTPPRLKKIARRVEEELRSSAGEEGLGERLVSWEKLARRMGLTDIDDLPAPRALVHSVLKGNTIPKINFVVDSANVTALKFRTPVGAFDLGKLRGTDCPPPRGRRRGDNADRGEQARRLRARGDRVCGPRRLFSRYSRDADFSKITDETTTVLCVVDGTPEIDPAVLLEGGAYLRDLIVDVAGPNMKVEGPSLAGTG